MQYLMARGQEHAAQPEQRRRGWGDEGQEQLRSWEGAGGGEDEEQQEQEEPEDHSHLERT